jgi:hypothetical protein
MMKMRLQALLIGVALLMIVGCATTEPRKAESPQPAPAPKAAPDMSGKPYVLAMGRYLASAPQFTVHVHSPKDQLIDSGVVVGPMERTIRLRRPDRLAVQVAHSQSKRQIWYDGSRLVCLEADRKAYASAPAKGSLDAVLASLRQGGLYVRPLASLCTADPGESLCANARRVSYVGKKTLDAQACHVVRIERDDAAIEVWIADAPQPLLLQTVVRQSDASVPERVSRFEKWDFQTRISDAAFKPKLPAGAYEVEMADMTGLP